MDSTTAVVTGPWPVRTRAGEAVTDDDHVGLTLPSSNPLHA